MDFDQTNREGLQMSTPYQNDPTMQDPYASNPASSGSPSGYSGYESPAYSASSYNSYPPVQQPPQPQEPNFGYESPGYATYGQQNPYATQGMQPYAAVLPDHPQSTMVLVLGIISIVGFAITGPFAWFFGSKARKEIAANPGVYKEGGILNIGWILGIIGTVFLILGTVAMVAYFIFIFVVIAGSGSF